MVICPLLEFSFFGRKQCSYKCDGVNYFCQIITCFIIPTNSLSVSLSRRKSLKLWEESPIDLVECLLMVGVVSMEDSPITHRPAEATGLGFVCFVVPQPRVLAVNRVDFGLFFFFFFHKFSNFTFPPPPFQELKDACPKPVRYRRKFGSRGSRSQHGTDPSRMRWKWEGGGLLVLGHRGWKCWNRQSLTTLPQKGVKGV